MTFTIANNSKVGENIETEIYIYKQALTSDNSYLKMLQIGSYSLEAAYTEYEV